MRVMPLRLLGLVLLIYLFFTFPYFTSLLLSYYNLSLVRSILFSLSTVLFIYFYFYIVIFVFCY